MQLKLANGQSINVGALVGKGGEGSVYEIGGTSKPTVVKVYHQPLEKKKLDKLNALVTLKSDKMLSIAAWPIDIVFGQKGDPRGFTMPFARGYKDIHMLYSPKSRKDNFGQANWRFLIHTATNVARAFAIVHESGCVIGDVNHGSVLAAQDARVQLIDCDSFQINLNGTLYPCEVGVGPYTPPELQNKSFHGVTRTANHDRFGLAVMIFHLLFMGRHPFAGRPLGTGDLSLEGQIEQYRFAYGQNHMLLQTSPPPATLQLNQVSSAVSSLFERAFAKGSSADNARPTAIEWVNALSDLEQQLKVCTTNTTHQVVKSAKDCPWCDIEQKTGIFLFPFIGIAAATRQAFDMAEAWAKIIAVTSPAQLQSIPIPATASIQPSSEAVIAGKAIKINKAWAAAVVLTAVAVTLISGGTFFIVLGFAWLIATKLLKLNPDATRFKSAYASAKGQWDRTQARWNLEAGIQKFTEKQSQLKSAKDELEKLPGQRQAVLNQLRANVDKMQRERFLASHTIDKAKIPGVGPARKATLASWNIDSALDVTEYKIRTVPGFGASYTSKMLDWRRSVESKYKFNPSLGVDQRDVSDIENKFLMTQQKFQSQLLAGPNELNQLKSHILKTRENLTLQIANDYAMFMRADADRKAAAISRKI